MISRREKMKRQFNSARESVFYAALDVLTDKKLNLSVREVEKIVKTYKDLPSPYGETKKGPKAPLSRTASVSSRTSSMEKDIEVSKSEAAEVTKRRSSEVKIEAVKSENKKNESESFEEITETPKPRGRGRPKSKQFVSDVKGIAVKLEPEDSALDSSVSAMDTSEIGTEDETLVNISVDDRTLLQSHSESESANVTTGNTDKTKIKVEGKRSVGRPRKIKSEAESQKDGDKETGLNEVKKAAPKKTRTRSSLPEIVDLVGDGDLGSEVKVKDEQEPMETHTKAAEKEITTKATSERKERRHSHVVKMTDKEKAELVEKYPSAKHVSDHIKTELSGYFKNNKLLVSNKLRQKVQTALLNGKRRNRFGNGISIDHSQRKIDTFFVKSPPHCDPESHKSPAKNVSRVLNELSPTRDRLEANSIERTTILRSGLKVSDYHTSHRNGSTQHARSPTVSEKSFDGRSVGSPEGRGKRNGSLSVREKLFHDDSRRITRSRESTPESTTSSVLSAGSHKRRQENTRTRTRSMTPSSAGKESDESESENICNGESRRLRR